MLNITFKEIDKEIEKQIVEIWGNWVTEYGCLHYGDGCYSLAAIYDGKPVGFISTYPVQLSVPLQMYSDAYIDDLEVHEDFRRQGIARELLSMTAPNTYLDSYLEEVLNGIMKKLSSLRLLSSLGEDFLNNKASIWFISITLSNTNKE